jgi:hypothetical protein
MVKTEFDQNFHLVQTLAIYIYGRLLLAEHILNHETVFSDSFPISRNCLPKFGAVPTLVSNYFQSMSRRRNPRVPLRLSRRGLCLGAFGSSIESSNLRQSTNSSSAPARVFFPCELLHSCSLFCFISHGLVAPWPRPPRVQPLQRAPLLPHAAAAATGSEAGESPCPMRTWRPAGRPASPGRGPSPQVRPSPAGACPLHSVVAP